MAVYFEGNAYIDECLVQNTDIKNSNITTSSLDMNLENITSVKDPILPQDAATKKYVDEHAFQFTTTDVNLSGTVGSMVFSIGTGVHMIQVTNLVTNGPSALFNVTKSDASKCGQSNRFTASAGSGSNTTLLLEWGASSDIYLRKTNDLYDGSYRAVLL